MLLLPLLLLLLFSLELLRGVLQMSFSMLLPHLLLHSLSLLLWLLLLLRLLRRLRLLLCWLLWLLLRQLH